MPSPLTAAVTQATRASPAILPAQVSRQAPPVQDMVFVTMATLAMQRAHVMSTTSLKTVPNTVNLVNAVMTSDWKTPRVAPTAPVSVKTVQLVDTTAQHAATASSSSTALSAIYSAPAAFTGVVIGAPALANASQMMPEGSGLEKTVACAPQVTSEWSVKASIFS